ncbi:50S ribosomal protein L13 [Candidatus Pacearchaeota archaeon]|nr:50S ribosomal protein L13 [Candidatus Pacearchaeota archaeon]
MTHKNKQIIIDAADCVLGRVASFAAKQSLLGSSIIILNCNKALITGNKKNILYEYKRARARGGSSQKGPNISKMPQKIMKRTIRGMLPYKQARGSMALKRIICYNETPKEFENAEKLSLKKPLQTKSITIEQLSREV